MPLGLYISVPFCRSKCSYCNFASDVFSSSIFQRYIDRVCADIFRSADRKSTRLNSSHLGTSYAVFGLKKKRESLPADVKRQQEMPGAVAANQAPAAAGIGAAARSPPRQGGGQCGPGRAAPLPPPGGGN